MASIGLIGFGGDWDLSAAILAASCAFMASIGLIGFGGDLDLSAAILAASMAAIGFIGLPPAAGVRFALGFGGGFSHVMTSCWLAAGRSNCCVAHSAVAGLALATAATFAKSSNLSTLSLVDVAATMPASMSMLFITCAHRALPSADNSCCKGMDGSVTLARSVMEVTFGIAARVASGMPPFHSASKLSHALQSPSTTALPALTALACTLAIKDTRSEGTPMSSMTSANSCAVCTCLMNSRVRVCSACTAFTSSLLAAIVCDCIRATPYFWLLVSSHGFCSARKNSGRACGT